MSDRFSVIFENIFARRQRGRGAEGPAVGRGAGGRGAEGEVWEGRVLVGWANGNNDRTIEQTFELCPPYTSPSPLPVSPCLRVSPPRVSASPCLPSPCPRVSVSPCLPPCPPAPLPPCLLMTHILLLSPHGDSETYRVTWQKQTNPKGYSPTNHRELQSQWNRLI